MIFPSNSLDNTLVVLVLVVLVVLVVVGVVVVGGVGWGCGVGVSVTCLVPNHCMANDNKSPIPTLVAICSPISIEYGRWFYSGRSYENDPFMPVPKKLMDVIIYIDTKYFITMILKRFHK